MTIGCLTIESLSKLFCNNFELANHAIQAAQILIKAGKEVNPANLLDEMARYPDRFNIEKMREVFENELDEKEESE